jgi:hypothetical protein
MRLTDHDLKQIDEVYLASLSPEQLLYLSRKMLDDLRVARDRLNQTPQNSSRPSSSMASWAQAKPTPSASQEEKSEPAKEPVKASPEQDEQNAKPDLKEPSATTAAERKRKPGKQPGAKGVGRRVELPVTGEENHVASHCVACEAAFSTSEPFRATTGLYVLDVVREAHGVAISHVKHLYGERRCGCGHVTRTQPGRCEAEDGWQVALSEWHLVGPTLASLIICLSLRLRLSRPRIREFLSEWLGVELSVGCINQCLAEGGRAMAPLEDELVAEIQSAALLHADETGWKENGRTVWLWVLTTSTVTLYLIGRRSWEVIACALEQYAGWLMSDGYGQYRHYGKRLRCLAHILRKARGLAESTHPAAAAFGQQLLDYLGLFIRGIYQARGDPTLDLPTHFAPQLAQLKILCERHRDQPHDKTRQLARELLNDWDAIWQLLAFPELPITNNVAERALRHWVIARKLSYGTRTHQGSRAFTLLASVIDTCRQRGVSPWPYIAQVIAERRQGNAAPPLPLPVS